MFILAKNEMTLGNVEEAQKLFEICIELDEKNIHARTELGKLYASQGRVQEAEELFSRVLEIDPDNGYVKNLLSNLRGKNTEKGKQPNELKSLVEKAFEAMSEEEKEDVKRRFDFLKQCGPQSIEMERENLMYYLKFLYQNITVLERFFQLDANGEPQALNSATLIIPNDVEIKDGNLTQRKNL